MDHYSKTPTAITTSEGTVFAQRDKKKKKGGVKAKKPKAPKDPKDFDKEWWKDKECYIQVRQEGTSCLSVLCQTAQQQ